MTHLTNSFIRNSSIVKKSKSFDASEDPAFEKAQDREGLKDWLMRAYFNPTKHSEESYFDSRVSRDNVLNYISEMSNGFPQSPWAVVKQWNLLPSLRSGLRWVSDGEKQEKVEEKERVNTKGAVTLAKIGEEFNITSMMVKKISDQGIIKVNTMFTALNHEKSAIAEEASEKIENAFLNAAEAFADACQNASTPKEILELLASKGIISNTDTVTYLDDVEVQAFTTLLEFVQEGITQSELEDIFLADLKKPINVFNSLQAAVARQVFVPPKKGRPKKVV